MLATERAHWQLALLLLPDQFQPFLLSCPGAVALIRAFRNLLARGVHRALTVVDVIHEIAKSKSSFHIFRG
jgi:hypothetical protein